MSARTPPEVKCELGRVRAGTGHVAAPCSDQRLQRAIGALLSGFRFFASNSGCQTQLFGVLPPGATASPCVKFGASVRVLVTPGDR